MICGVGIKPSRPQGIGPGKAFAPSRPGQIGLGRGHRQQDQILTAEGHPIASGELQQLVGMGAAPDLLLKRG